MSQYEQPAGRALEIVVGVITMVIALLFLLQFILLVMNAEIKYATFIGGVVLLLFTYWFGLVSYRLILNVPNGVRGLFSTGGLKFWCSFFGMSFFVLAFFALYMGHWYGVISCIGSSYGCYKGWCVASNREDA
jgi:hypothetical protein